jgi:hypothetical protein
MSDAVTEELLRLEDALQVWVNTGDGWKQAAFVASPLPVDAG